MWPYEVVITILLHRWGGICAQRGTVVNGRAGIWLDSQVQNVCVPFSVTIPMGVAHQHSPSFQMFSRKHLQRFHNKLNLFSRDIQRHSISSESWLCIHPYTYIHSLLISPITSVKPQGWEDSHLGKRLLPFPKSVYFLILKRWTPSGTGGI